MRQRTRTVLRWSAGSVASALLVLAVPISAVALPYPLFGYKMQQGRCAVYSDAEFDEDRVSVLLDDSAWTTGNGPARVYCRAELLVEYLIEVEEYGFEDIMDDGMTFERAYSGLMQWYGRSKGVG